MNIKRKCIAAVGIILCCALLTGPAGVSAYTGSMGYEGGISAADPYEANTYKYREVCFLTGKPIIFEGTMTVKKNVRQGRINTTYTYELENAEQDATLTRVIVMDTQTETKENGQTVESSTITRTPTEIVRVGDATYRLSEYRFSRSGIVTQTRCLYNAGEYQLTKTYDVLDTGGTITVEMTGNQYGFDQYWSCKTGTVNMVFSAKPQQMKVQYLGEVLRSSYPVLKGVSLYSNEPRRLALKADMWNKTGRKAYLSMMHNARV